MKVILCIRIFMLLFLVFVFFGVTYECTCASLSGWVFYPLLEVGVAIVVPLNDNSGVSEWSSQLHLPLCAISPIVPANCRVCFSSPPPPLVSTRELMSFLHCSV